MRNERKLLTDMILLGLALLLFVFPCIEASASRYAFASGTSLTPEAALPSPIVASLIDMEPQRLFPGMEPLQPHEPHEYALPASHRPFSSFSAPDLERPAPPPKPTPTPSASASAANFQVIKMAAPVAPYKQYVTTAYYLNVRESASSKASILRVVEKGDLLNVTNKTGNGWLALYSGGFVHGAYAEPVESQAASIKLTLATAAPSAADTYDDAELAKPTSTVQSDSGLTTALIEEILQGTALEEQSLVSAILEIEEEYGINAYFTIAVMKLESGNGKSRLAKSKNNLFGLNATGGGNAKAYAFDTKADSVRKFGQLIADNYVEKGYTTIEKVARKYCPANDDWSKLVKRIMYSDHHKLTDSRLL